MMFTNIGKTLQTFLFRCVSIACFNEVQFEIKKVKDFRYLEIAEFHISFQVRKIIFF
jgi:hypothetical protein